MEMWEDYYSILQVHFDAEPEVIQSAYRRLCRKYHPDVCPAPGAEDMMRRLNRAYSVLSDERRGREYHLQWLARQRPRPSAQPRAPIAPSGTGEAELAISSYFKHLGARRFSEAYAQICRRDRQRFSLHSFLEWQESVSNVYEIGSFSLRLFKRLSGTGEYKNTPAEEYTVTICEKNRATGKVSEYSFTKTAVLDGSAWRVYLGYSDLAPIARRFQFMISTQDEAEALGHWEKYREVTDLTVGLPNKNGFLERFIPEKYRYERYGRQFSVCLLRLVMPDRPAVGKGFQKLLKFSGFVIKKSMRAIDSVSYIGGDTFALILSETPKPAALRASRRLASAVRHDVCSCFDTDVEVLSAVRAYTGGGAEELLSACAASLAPADAAVRVRGRIFAG